MPDAPGPRPLGAQTTGGKMKKMEHQARIREMKRGEDGDMLTESVARRIREKDVGLTQPQWRDLPPCVKRVYHAMAEREVEGRAA
jgi:hypothetical protein